MDVKVDMFPDNDERIVYVRPVKVEELPEDLREQVGEQTDLYALHDTDGARLALVAGRQMAFALARQNDYAPVNVH
ncbi:MAG: DUF1150 family protein [Rhodobacteraceae bacterium]|nr:DUF1150 family protein [Paracoccaceae bacterium]